jgi:hypothetical protein
MRNPCAKRTYANNNAHRLTQIGSFENSLILRTANGAQSLKIGKEQINVSATRCDAVSLLD